MNKEFKQMTCLLSTMLCLTACAAWANREDNTQPQNTFVPSFGEPITFTNDITIYEEQNVEEIDTDPTVEGTYDIFTITYYCGCDICNGDWGSFDALGEPLTIGTVACNVLPLGTVVYIDGERYVVRDRLSSIYDGENRIDIYVEDHDTANELGIRYGVEVFIENY